MIETKATGRLAPLLSACAVILCLLLASTAAPAADVPPPEVQAEIDFLLGRVADSGYVFIRNGSDHESVEAAGHMRRKYEHFEDEITTAEEFIELSATRSLITKRAYKVRFPDGEERETARWLLDELAGYREGVRAASPAPNDSSEEGSS